MLTLVETPSFRRLWPDYWTAEERTEFALWLAPNPEAGDEVPGTGGVRKVKWKSKGTGKSGGVRVVYFNRLHPSEIWLLLIYSNSVMENIPSPVLRLVREELKNDQESKSTRKT